eukprot:1142087-Pelagomonas_calceolata.AAC.8
MRPVRAMPATYTCTLARKLCGNAWQGSCCALLKKDMQCPNWSMDPTLRQLCTREEIRTSRLRGGAFGGLGLDFSDMNLFDGGTVVASLRHRQKRHGGSKSETQTDGKPTCLQESHALTARLMRPEISQV